jgi:hypothetical protein
MTKTLITAKSQRFAITGLSEMMLLRIFADNAFARFGTNFTRSARAWLANAIRFEFWI